MNRDFTPILLFVVLLILEFMPFLYQDSYSSSDISWGWIFGLPLALLLLNKARTARDQ